MKLTRERARRGAVLLLVLWLLIMLGMIGLSYTGSVRMQLAGASQQQGRQQATWAARAGVEHARAVLAAADPALLTNLDPLFNDAEAFANCEVGAARYSLFIPPVDPANEEPRYGLTDEGARLNVNLATEEMLLKLPGTTIELCDALQDWRDADAFARPAGAEEDYYLGLPEPYLPRNAPLRSLHELTRIRGWGELYALAEPDPYRRFASEPEPTATEDATEARMLLSLLTAWSATRQIAPDGEAALDLNEAEANEMRRRVPGLSEVEANAIVNHRRGRRFTSPIELFDVNQQGEAAGGNNAAQGGGQGGNRAQGQQGRGGGNNRNNQGNQSSQGNQNNQGNQAKAFNLKRIGEIIGYFSASQENQEGLPAATQSGGTKETPGIVNINTAPRDVLLTLPELTEQLADEIIRRREAEGAFKQVGELVELNGVTEDSFKKLYPLAGTRSDRYRVNSEGFDPATGARARIQAVLAIADDGVRIVHWREE